jgi:transposase
VDPEILRPIAHRTVAQQETLTLIRARDVLVRLRTGAVKSVRGVAKPCRYRLPASSTLCFAKRCLAVLPPGLAEALTPLLHQIADMTVKIKQYDEWPPDPSNIFWFDNVKFQNGLLFLP